MRKAAKSISGALLAVLYGCGTVCAATVSGPSGQVLVNDGNGFVPLARDAELAPGVQVMLKPGAVAHITYAGNCTVKVGSDRVWTIQATTPCANGEGEIDLTTRMNQAGPGDNGFGGGALLIGGVVIGGGLLIGCLVSWCQSKSSSP